MLIKNDRPLPPGLTMRPYLRVSHKESAERGIPIAGQRRRRRTYCDEHKPEQSYTLVRPCK